jgi:hypothetical protein
MTRTDFYIRPQRLNDRRIAHPYALDGSGLPMGSEGRGVGAGQAR